MSEDAARFCPECGQANRSEARFCLACGASLTRACPRCGVVARAPARFCDACGEPLEPVAGRAGDDMEGECRTVTVLFADAVGSTPLAERLGEEEMYSLMQSCLARMTEAVHHFEGHVASFTGDGVMAVFGAPVAHEESERRAVAAALRMQRALEEQADEVRARHGVECRFRVGLNTGPVVVGKVSDEMAMEFTAVGDTVNLAARMEQLAEPGAVYLTESTYRRVTDFFQCQPLGTKPVKGKSDPVAVYRVLWEMPVRTRFEVAAERGLTSFVGRDDELALLERRLARCRQGRGQVVHLSGEAGIGKSRLVLEFRRRTAGTGVRWVEGHCISYGRNMPYHPFVELVKQAFGVKEGEDEAGVIERLAQGTRGWDDAARSTVPYLRYLLSVDPGDDRVAGMDPRERRAGILDALRALLVGQAGGHEPLVVALEDLHWVDEASQQALAAVVDVVPSAPVLLLVTSRPGSLHIPERTYTTRLALDPLAEAESAGLVRAVLGASPPAELEQLVAEKAEGNPFYTEEVIRSLLEERVLVKSNGGCRLVRPVEEVRIPGTVEEVILSRIDRLDRPAKSAIQLASVIGREFTVRLLQRISDVQARLEQALGELTTLELVYQKAYFPELVYMFKHALTHDVAYATLMAQRRRQLHRTVATVIEDLYADRLAEQYETLAHHYYEGEEWEKALDYLTRAGDKAAAAFANQDALDHYARALVVAERLGDSRLATVASVARRRAYVHFSIGCYTDAIGDLERRLDAARRLDDRHLEARTLAHQGVCQVFAHEYEAAEVTLRGVLALAGAADFHSVRVMASLFLGLNYKVSNRHGEADALFAFANDHASDLDDAFARGLWGVLGSRTALWAGRLGVAVELAVQGRAAAEAFMPYRLFGLWNEAHARASRGEYEEARRLLEEALATGERVGDVWARVRCLNTLGYVYGELCDYGRAMEWNQRGLEATVATPGPVPEVEMNARLNLAENLVAQGRMAEAAAHFRRVETVVRDPDPTLEWMRWRYAQRFFHSYGEYWLVAGDTARALAHATECLATAEHSGSRKYTAKARRLRGQAYLGEGRLDEAEAELVDALAVATEVGSPPQVWKTQVALAQLRAAQGRPGDARQAYVAALEVIDRVAAGLTDESLRTTFLASGEVEAIRRAASH